MMHSSGVAHRKGGWRVPACLSGGVRNVRNISLCRCWGMKVICVLPGLARCHRGRAGRWGEGEFFCISCHDFSLKPIPYFHTCVFPTREFLPEHSTRTVAPRGDRAKANLPSQLRENGSDCGAWPGRRFRSRRESTWHEAKSYLMTLSCFWSEHTADWKGEQKIRPQEKFWPWTYIISRNVGTNEVISRVYIFTCIVCSPFLLLMSLWCEGNFLRTHSIVVAGLLWT